MNIGGLVLKCTHGAAAFRHHDPEAEPHGNRRDNRIKSQTDPSGEVMQRNKNRCKNQQRWNRRADSADKRHDIGPFCRSLPGQYYNSYGRCQDRSNSQNAKRSQCPGSDFHRNRPCILGQNRIIEISSSNDILQSVCSPFCIRRCVGNNTQEHGSHAEHNPPQDTEQQHLIFIFFHDPHPFRALFVSHCFYYSDPFKFVVV